MVKAVFHEPIYRIPEVVSSFLEKNAPWLSKKLIEKIAEDAYEKISKEIDKKLERIPLHPNYYGVSDNEIIIELKHNKLTIIDNATVENYEYRSCDPVMFPELCWEYDYVSARYVVELPPPILFGFYQDESS